MRSGKPSTPRAKRGGRATLKRCQGNVLKAASDRRAANIIRLKGTNTIAGMECLGKWMEEKERREMYGEKTTSQAEQREGRAGNQIAMEKKKERRGYNPRE